jgi:hypothetical protein
LTPLKDDSTLKITQKFWQSSDLEFRVVFWVAGTSMGVLIWLCTPLSLSRQRVATIMKSERAKQRGVLRNGQIQKMESTAPTV